ncbi:MAG: hypothetical protein A2201_03345 [Alicyclobacillus sp. RIFOXYA1_FULL_53_8]|nr:MAG: hypothetical protein A2201_03345 [Alicyclobacillus sp. RIFOXYA1_FULL_53_8]
MTNQFLFDDVEQRVQAYIQHPYLVRNKVRQSVSRFHFDVLSVLLQNAYVDVAEANKVMDAVLLLQHGLSVHDEVETPASLLRQLIVLAGDYSSGHYYRVLAGLGNMSLMAKLCEAVVKINEAKTSLHARRDVVSSDEYMELLLVIHGELLFAVVQYYELDPQNWLPEVESLVRAHLVHQERIEHRELTPFTSTQAHGWLPDAMDRLVKENR